MEELLALVQQLTINQERFILGKIGKAPFALVKDFAEDMDSRHALTWAYWNRDGRECSWDDAGDKSFPLDLKSLMEAADADPSGGEQLSLDDA